MHDAHRIILYKTQFEYWVVDLMVNKKTSQKIREIISLTFSTDKCLPVTQGPYLICDKYELNKDKLVNLELKLFNK